MIARKGAAASFRTWSLFAVATLALGGIAYLTDFAIGASIVMLRRRPPAGAAKDHLQAAEVTTRACRGPRHRPTPGVTLVTFHR